MSLDLYSFTISENATTFRFTSQGPKGTIPKVIQFQPTQTPGVYNLGFGDMDPATGEWSDLVVSDNQDTDKVLATVAAAALLFTDQYPEAVIFFQGSTPARTALYGRKLSRHYPAIEQQFEVLGEKEGDYIPFQAGTYYESFLVIRKK